MDAIILAAGRGERLRPLTDSLPKPLIEIHGMPLIEAHLYRLAHAGFKRVIINLHHLGSLIQAKLGSGKQFGLSIQYSIEKEVALETAGGIIHALALIRSQRFAVISADVLCDFPFAQLKENLLNQNTLGHLILVNNPGHHQSGDFALYSDGHIGLKNKSETRLEDPASHHTFSGIACFDKALFEPRFKHEPQGKLALRTVLYDAIKQNSLTGQLYSGLWSDIGTIERLDQANQSEETGAYIESIRQSTN